MIPKDASPYLFRVPTINVADKKKRGKQLNFTERSEFSGICRFGPEQLIECYGDSELCGGYLNAYSFAVMCSRCPHRLKRGMYDSFRPGSAFDGFVVFDCMKEFIDEENPKSFVYFIDDGEFIKIGKAKDVYKRATELQTGNGRPLTVLYVVPCLNEKAAYRVESSLHDVYSRHRREGEWFDIRDKLDPISFSVFKPDKSSNDNEIKTPHSAGTE